MTLFMLPVVRKIETFRNIKDCLGLRWSHIFFVIVTGNRAEFAGVEESTPGGLSSGSR